MAVHQKVANYTAAAAAITNQKLGLVATSYYSPTPRKKWALIIQQVIHAELILVARIDLTVGGRWSVWFWRNLLLRETARQDVRENINLWL